MPCDYKIVLWRLEQDAQGYPPASVEGLWAKRTATGFQVASIPFYAYGIAPGDTISIREDGEQTWFEALQHNGGASVFRVRVKALGDLEQVRAALEEFGCPSEVEKAVRMLAVEVPPTRALDTLLYYLLTQREAGALDFEEGVLRHAIPEEFR
ncbi:DUF4265 domain-containing protein [Pseudomonas putida]|uniref:DUF4265 domain-containing protein n=1 Tax=Pseudomonas putida TaxID=303 RepID=A0A7W2L3G6_PSEPU|nr:MULTISPECIES: DUF4265 domain-containing protein [Pseudomonas]MBA6117779.1 DUF4265 domain-containing protein [Pseudomonas putida]MBI6941907.1 DUF4265 domain-containing protein [Pseudomonas putida]MBI6958234.1 DUF4265 domain-containing protein [Pseudomonas putida]MCZ9638640.1 DUF4265 domain-containing protein [Pseudomonas putida]MEC4878379.1 DUF4265 domain-containing protein [Pseudomonas sp. NC26]